MVCCAAFQCKNKPNKTLKRSFHRFPKDKELCEMWIHNLRRENYVPSASAVICCEHFEDSCYECYASPRKLKPGTVPTIFQYPSHLPKRFKKIKSDAKIWRPKFPIPESISPVPENTYPVSENRSPVPENESPVLSPVDKVVDCEAQQVTNSNQTAVLEHSYAVEGDSVKVVTALKRKLLSTQDELISCRKKLKTDKQRVRRFIKKVETLTEKIASLEETVKTLKAQNTISSTFDKSLQITFTEEFLQGLQ